MKKFLGFVLVIVFTLSAAGCAGTMDLDLHFVSNDPISHEIAGDQAQDLELTSQVS